MRAAGFQNVGGDGVVALRGISLPLNPNLPKRGGRGVGGEVPVRGQVLPPDHEFAVLCTMPCCGSACPCTAVSGTPGGPSCSLEFGVRLMAGGQPSGGGNAACSGSFWLLLEESSRTGRQADARAPEQMIVRGGTARVQPRDGKTSKAPGGGAESEQAWWRGRRAGVASAQPNDQPALGEHEGTIGTESGTLPGRHSSSAMVDILLENRSMGRAVGSGTTALPTRNTIHQRGGKLDGQRGAAAVTHMGGVSQEKGAPGAGTQARRAAQDAGTAERAESSNYDFVISLVDSIRYGAIPAASVHCSESLVLLLRVRTIRKAPPSRGRLSAAENFVGFRWLVLVHNMSGDRQLHKEAMKRALREEKVRKEAQEQEARNEAARKEAEDLTHWERDQEQQDKEKQERKAQHLRIQQLREAELAKATEEIQQLNEAMKALQVKKSEMEDSTAKSMSALVHQAGGQLASGSFEDKKEYLRHMLNQAKVKSAEEALLVGNLAPLTVSRMFAQQGTASKAQSVGHVLVVVSVTENDSNLSMHEVVTFLQSKMPRMATEAVKSITNTPMSATSALIPKVFEAKIATGEVLTPEFLTTMKMRHVAIAGKMCTLGFESSVAVRVQFSREERQRLFIMQQICQMAGMTQDEFDMFLTAAVRTALKQSGSGVEDHLLVAGFQRQGKSQGVLKRLQAKDLPQMRISVATEQAKRDMSALALRISLGAGPDNCLFSVDGYCQDVGQGNREVGVTAARERALQKAEKVLGKGYSMLNSAASLALSALEVCKQGLEPDEAKTKLKPILEQLSGLVADTSGSSDITAMFVQPELVEVLQKVYKGESDQLLPLTWLNMIALTNDMKAEVDRRRAALDELITVNIGPLPPIERIWTDEAQDKTALREMNMKADDALWRLLMSMEVSCLVAEPITVMLDRLTWDVKSGIIIIVQSLQQLCACCNYAATPQSLVKWSNMKRERREEEPAAIFTVTGGNAAGQTNHLWAHAQLRQDTVNMSALKAPMRMVKAEEAQRVRMKILPATNSMRAASEVKAATKTRLLQDMLAGEGFWIPCEYNGAGGARCKTIVKPAEGQVVTKLSQFDSSPHEYHIRNIHDKVAQPREECDDILALLGELDAEDMAKPVAFSDEYVIYLIQPLAEALRRSKRDREEWIKRLSVGSSTRVTLMEMAQSHLELKLQAYAAGGVWLPWNAGEEDDTSRIVGILGGPQEHDKKAGGRWIAHIAAKEALVAMSVMQDDETSLRNSVQAILQKKETQLAAFSGGEGVSLILFANTVFAEGLRTGAARPGFPLPEMQFGQAAFEEFVAQIGRTAQGRGQLWTSMSPEKMQEAKCWQVIEDEEAAAVLTAQWQENPARQLKLTRSELGNLEERVGKSIGPFCVLRNTTGEQQDQPAFMVMPQGPGVVLVAATDADGRMSTLDETRADWTKRLLEQQPDLRRFTWLTDLLDKKWPELLYGTAAARMVNKMVRDEKAIAMQVKTVFAIIFPETSRPIEAIASREGGCLPVAWGVQFGPENQAAAAKLQKSIATLVKRTPACIPLQQVLDTVQNEVHKASTDAVYDGVETALEQICILPGVRLVREPMQHTLQYVGKNVPASIKAGSGPAVPDLRKLVPHPAMLDTRCAEIALAAAEVSSAQMRNVGGGLTCLLFAPAASMDHEDAWPEQDPRFEKWDVMRGATIEDLNKLMANRKRGQEAEGCASAGGEPSAMDEDSVPKQDGLEQGNEKRAHTQGTRQ